MDEMHNITQDVNNNNSSSDTQQSHKTSDLSDVLGVLDAIGIGQGNSGGNSDSFSSPTSGNSEFLNQVNNLTNVAMTILGALQAEKSADKNYRRNRELMKYQSELNEAAAQADYARMKELLEDERYYNLPANVRARLQAAGISPGVAMSGSGSSSSISATTPSPQNTANSKGASLNSMNAVGVSPFSPAMVSPLELSQARLNNAEAKKVENETPSSVDFATKYTAEIENLLAQSSNQEAQASWTSYQEQFEQTVRSARVGAAEQTYKNMQRQGTLLLGETARSFASAGESTSNSRLLTAQFAEVVTNLAFLKALNRGKLANLAADTHLKGNAAITEESRYRMFSAMAAQYFQTADWQRFYNRTMKQNFKDFKHGDMTLFGETMLRELRGTTANTAHTWTRSLTDIVEASSDIVMSAIAPGAKPRPIGFK